MPRNSEEYRGVVLLDEALGRASPFRTARTQYVILGDGPFCRALKAVRRMATAPVVPIVTIDPYYRDKRRGPSVTKDKYRSSRSVTYVPKQAEKYAFNQKALARVDHLVIVSICAHTPAYAFVSRARKAIGKRIKLYALCVKCCFPGLRAATEQINGHGNWQLLYPRGLAAASRPQKEAEIRWRAQRIKERKAMRAKAKRVAQPKRVARPKCAARPKRTAGRPKGRGAPKGVRS